MLASVVVKATRMLLVTIVLSANGRRTRTYASAKPITTMTANAIVARARPCTPCGPWARAAAGAAWYIARYVLCDASTSMVNGTSTTSTSPSAKRASTATSIHFNELSAASTSASGESVMCAPSMALLLELAQRHRKLGRRVRADDSIHRLVMFGLEPLHRLDHARPVMRERLGQIGLMVERAPDRREHVRDLPDVRTVVPFLPRRNGVFGLLAEIDVLHFVCVARVRDGRDPAEPASRGDCGRRVVPVHSDLPRLELGAGRARIRNAVVPALVSGP